MNFGTKNINLLVIVLVILNALTLGALWYTLLMEPEFIKPRPGNKQGTVLAFMENELQLDDHQLAEFEKLREEHFYFTRELNERQHSLKREILEEAFNKNPDKQKVDSLSELIGENQVLLEKSIYMHFRQMINLCSEEQQTKLFELISETAAPLIQAPPPDGRRPPGPPPKR